MRLLIGSNHYHEQSTTQTPRTLSPEHLRQIYKKTFSSKDAMIVLEDLAAVSGMYRNTFSQGNQDLTAFLEGQRSMFLYIAGMLEDDGINGNIEGKE